jgi:polyisoprenoid-binding protein YceI
MMLRKTIGTLVIGLAVSAASASAADYVIDKEGQHAFINFRIGHLGYSWVYGTFRDFDGRFSFDAAQPEASSVQVKIRTASVDTNQAMRDKHLRDKDFLNTSKYPEARFESTAVKATGAGTFDITGNLTLNGVTRPVTIAAKLMGEGADPWGGYRAGFEGSTKVRLKDFAMAMDLGPASQEAELILSVEGVRQ